MRCREVVGIGDSHARVGLGAGDGGLALLADADAGWGRSPVDRRVELRGLERFRVGGQQVVSRRQFDRIGSLPDRRYRPDDIAVARDFERECGRIAAFGPAHRDRRIDVETDLQSAGSLF